MRSSSSATTSAGAAEGEVGVDPGGEGVEPLLVEARRQRERILAVLGVGEGRSAPQVEGLRQGGPGGRRVARGQLLAPGRATRRNRSASTASSATVSR